MGYVLSKAAKDWLKMFVNLATFMQNSFRAIIVMLGLVKKTLPNSGHVLAWQHVHWCALLWLRDSRACKNFHRVEKMADVVAKKLKEWGLEELTDTFAGKTYSLC